MASNLRDLVLKTIDLTLDVTTNGTPWDTPSVESEAGTEAMAEESSTDRPSGCWPWLGAVICAQMALQVAVEEAKGFVPALCEDRSSYAADLLCRGILESASLTWWLLEPGIGSERRLARSMVYRLHTAWELKTAIGGLGLGQTEDPSQYGELPGEVDAAIAALGPVWTYTSKKTTQRCRGESWQGPTVRVTGLVKHFWPQPDIPYRTLSAVAHGELLGLSRNMRLDNSCGLRPMQGPSNAVWLWVDTYLVLGALHFTAGRAANFLGLHDQLAALSTWAIELDDRLPRLRPAS